MEYIDTKMGEYEMGVGNNDAATLSLLGGNNGGILNNNRVTDFIGAQGVADGTATNAEVKCNREIIGNGIDANGRAFDSATVQSSFQRLCDRISDSENRTSDRLRDQDREAQANARIAAAAAHAAEITALTCCCEGKLLAVTLAKDAEIRELTRDVTAANQAKLEALIITKCGG